MTTTNEWEPKGQLEVYAPAGYVQKTDDKEHSYTVGTWIWKEVFSLMCANRWYTILTVEADGNYRRYTTDAPRFRTVANLTNITENARIEKLESAIAHAMLTLQAGGSLTTPQAVAAQSRYALETINGAWSFLFDTNIKPAKSFEEKEQS